jgi:hypothetical protein
VSSHSSPQYRGGTPPCSIFFSVAVKNGVQKNPVSAALSGAELLPWRKFSLIVCTIAVPLSSMERDIVLGWSEYCRDDSFHYGGAAIEVPEELAILNGLRETPLERYCRFSEEQVDIIRDWMEKAISRRYGSAQYVTPPEKALHEKLNSISSLLTPTQDDMQ